MILSTQRFLKKNAKEGLGFVMLAALIFGLFSVPLAFQKKGSDVWAIRVNNQPVSYTRFMQEVIRYKEFITSLKNTYGQFASYVLSSMGMGNNPEQIAIDKLIRQEILDQLSFAVGVQIHADYVLSKTKDRDFMRNFISDSAINADGTFDLVTLRRELSYYGMSNADFEEVLYKGIQRDFLINLFQIGFYVPRFDTNYIFSMRQAGRFVSVVEIPYEKILKRVKQEQIAEESARNYFLIRNKSTGQYWSEEYRDGVVFKIKRSFYDTVVSDQEIVNYYEQNKAKKYVKTPAKVVVQKITDADLILRFPEKTLSDVISSILDNKEEYSSLWQAVDSFSRGTHEESFERAAFGLKKPGDISSVVELSDGTSVVLRLVQTVPREYKTLDSVRDIIQKEMSTNRFKKQFMEEANSIIRQADVERFSRRENVERVLISRITRETGDSITKHIFQIKRIGDSIAYVDKDYGYIIQLLHVDPSVEQSFEAVKDVVINDMYEEKARAEMKTVLDSVQTSIKEKGFDDAIAKYDAKILFEDIIHPDIESEMKKLEKYGVYSEVLSFLDKKGMTYVLKTEPNGIFLHVKTIHPTEKNIESKEMSKEIREIYSEKLSLEANALVASFYRNATIEISDLIQGNRSEE